MPEFVPTARGALATSETPLKTVQLSLPGPDVVSRKVLVESKGQAVQPEVKNTFIHFGSPLRAVSLTSPPKTVPSNFAPEVAYADLLHTPTGTPLVMHARTPYSAGGSTNGIFANAAPPLPMHAAPPVPALPTLLRLSDFLPSPAGSHAVSHAVGPPQPMCRAVDSTATFSLTSASLHPFNAGAAPQMPQVPLLPGGQLQMLPMCADVPHQHLGSCGLSLAQFPAQYENGMAMASSSFGIQGCGYNVTQPPFFPGEPAPAIAGPSHFAPPPPPSGPPTLTFQDHQTEARLMQNHFPCPQAMGADHCIATGNPLDNFGMQHSLLPGNDSLQFSASMGQFSDCGVPNALAFGNYVGAPMQFCGHS